MYTDANEQTNILIILLKNREYSSEKYKLLTNNTTQQHHKTTTTSSSTSLSGEKVSKNLWNVLSVSKKIRIIEKKVQRELRKYKIKWEYAIYANGWWWLSICRYILIS